MIAIPATCPRRLAIVARREKTYHRLGLALGVNVYYLHRYFALGIEPKNPAVRVKMFLPRTVRKPRPKSRPAVWDDPRQFEIETRSRNHEK